MTTLRHDTNKVYVFRSFDEHLLTKNLISKHDQISDIEILTRQCADTQKSCVVEDWIQNNTWKNIEYTQSEYLSSVLMSMIDVD